jgi:DNA-binding transcriptional MocR family regulator
MNSLMARHQIILGYAHLNNTDIREGILRLKEVLD